MKNLDSEHPQFQNVLGMLHLAALEIGLLREFILFTNDHSESRDKILAASADTREKIVKAIKIASGTYAPQALKGHQGGGKGG